MEKLIKEQKSVKNAGGSNSQAVWSVYEKLLDS
jgi:hypothetical protein